MARTNINGWIFRDYHSTFLVASSFFFFFFLRALLVFKDKEEEEVLGGIFLIEEDFEFRFLDINIGVMRDFIGSRNLILSEVLFEREEEFF